MNPARESTFWKSSWTDLQRSGQRVSTFWPADRPSVRLLFKVQRTLKWWTVVSYCWLSTLGSCKWFLVLTFRAEGTRCCERKRVDRLMCKVSQTLWGKCFQHSVAALQTSVGPADTSATHRLTCGTQQADFLRQQQPSLVPGEFSMNYNLCKLCWSLCSVFIPAKNEVKDSKVTQFTPPAHKEPLEYPDFSDFI